MQNTPANTIAKLTICYESGSGELTQRGVSVTEFDAHEMLGFCHLREKSRTFLYDRIFSCVDAKTGEVVNNVHEYLQTIYKKSALYALDTLCNNNYEALQVLLYVGKADGQLREPERKVIAAACKVLTGDVRITDEMVRELLDSMTIPSLHSFKVAVGKVAKHGDPTIMRRLMLACRTIVNTQQTVAAAEQEALDYMAKRFAIAQ